MIITSSNSHMNTFKFREFKCNTVYWDHLPSSITKLILLFWSCSCWRDVFSLPWKVLLYIFLALETNVSSKFALGRNLKTPFTFSQESSGENTVTPNVVCGPLVS